MLDVLLFKCTGKEEPVNRRFILLMGGTVGEVVAQLRHTIHRMFTMINGGQVGIYMSTVHLRVRSMPTANIPLKFRGRRL